MIRTLPFIVDLVLTVVAIVDITLIDNARVRGLPKWAWVLVSILLFVVGPLLWFFVGRERLEPRNHGRYAETAASTPAPSAPRAPDDDPEFLSRLSREQQQAQRIRDLERELGERRAGAPEPEPEPGEPKPDDPKPNA